MNFSKITGMVFTDIQNNEDKLIWIRDDGSRYIMEHQQDCCESVTLEDIAGDLTDLVGTPILSAYEETSGELPAGVPEQEYIPDSQTWTFYRITTAKGLVVLRWYGSSNGCYSESVKFYKEGTPSWED